MTRKPSEPDILGTRFVRGSRRPCAHAQGYNQAMARRVSGGTEGTPAKNWVAVYNSGDPLPLIAQLCGS